MEGKEKIYGLDWGAPYLDAYDTKSGDATIVLNFNFNPEQYRNILNYTFSQLVWVYKNLPNRSSVTMIFDIRGLDNGDAFYKKFESDLKMFLQSALGSFRLNILFKK